MNHFITRFLIGLFLGLAVALLTAFNVVLFWVATGPRSLNAVSPYVEAALAPADQGYVVNIGETWLVWDGWKHPIDIRLRKVVIMDRDHQHFSTFPEISMGLDLLSLVQGKLLPTSLAITHPVLSLYQNDDRSISFGFRKAGEATTDKPATAEELAEVPLNAVLAPLMAADPNSNLRKLRNIKIVNADISVGNLHQGVFFNASGVEIVLKKTWHGMSAYGTANIQYDHYTSRVTARLELPKGQTMVEGSIKVDDLMPGALAELFAGNTLLSAIKCPISGFTNFLLTPGGELKHADFTMDAGNGSIETDQLEAPVWVSALHAEGTVGSGAKSIVISKLNGTIDSTSLEVKGKAAHEEAGWAIESDAVMTNIPGNDLRKLWPVKLAPEARTWVTSNVTEGSVPNVQVSFRIAAGDLAKPVLPKEDVDATVMLRGIKIRYLPEHPPMTDVQGGMHIDGVSLKATIDSARFLKQTKLSAGSMEIADLNADNPYIKVAFDINTDAKDAVHFLGLPRLQHAKPLNLNEETIEGTMSGHGMVGFSFELDKNGNDDITYDVTGNVKGLTQSGFMRKFDISNAIGTAHVNNQLVEFKGTGNVNDAELSAADIKYWFTSDHPDKRFNTFIDVSANAPVDSLPRFGYPAFGFLKGMLGLKASIKEGDDTELSQATIDLSHAAIDWSLFEWKKPDQEAATLEVSAEKTQEVARITAFHLTAKNADVRGVAELNKDFSDIRTVSVNNLFYAGSTLDHFDYEKNDGGYKVDMRGDNADLTPWLDAPGESTFSFEHFPALALKVDVKQVVLGKDRVLRGVKGELQCDVSQCGQADIAGATVDDKPFRFQILHNPKGIRQLSVHAVSGGAFLKALGVLNGMEGGDLSITGAYDDTGNHTVLKADADSTAFTVKDAPVLAKMLSLASLTGIFDNLQGKGIGFTKLHFPVTLSNDVITITEGKTHGDAIGMTMEGTITFPKRTMDLKGTFIPSYSLNNVLGHVPLVGNVLTGGEGQGVFAARYSITGPDTKPDVSVNPLSILTPGFLRGVFDIFDQPAKKSNEGK